MNLSRVYCWLLTICLLLAATPAYAQYRPYVPNGHGNVLLASPYPGSAYPPPHSPWPPNQGVQVQQPYGVAPSFRVLPPPTQVPYAQVPQLNSAVMRPYSVTQNPYPPHPGNPPAPPTLPYPYRPNVQGWSPYSASAMQPVAPTTAPIAAPSHSDQFNGPAAAPHWSNQPSPGVSSFGSIGSHAAAAGDPPPASQSQHAGQGAAAHSWRQKSADCSACGDLVCGGAGCRDNGGGICGPNNGMYFQYDRVYWSISAPNVTDIGHAPSERIITTPAGITLFYQNDLDTSFLDGDFSTGDRFDFGYLDCSTGWAASVLHIRHGEGISATGVSYVPFDPDGLMSGYQNANGDAFDDDLNFNNLFGRNGEDLGTPDGAGGFLAPFDGIPDTPAPADTGDLVTYLVTFGSTSVQNSTEMTGVELMGIYRPKATNVDTFDWYYGMRYLQIRDRFLISASGGFLDSMSLATNVDNDIVGPQVGARWAHRKGSFVFSAEGRFLLGYNFQRSKQSGNVATNAAPGGQNAPVSLTAHSTSRSVTDEQFSPLGELRLDMAYKINRVAAFRFGYTALVTSGIGRASEQVVYRLPDFGLNTAGNNDQTLFSNALTFGLEFNR